MPHRSESDSRKLLGRLRDTMAEEAKGQERLNKITHLIADSMGTEVCSIYLFRDEETLELCATEGLNRESVHKTRMRLGEGLVGQVARTSKLVNTADAPSEKGLSLHARNRRRNLFVLLRDPHSTSWGYFGVLVVQSKRGPRIFS